MAPREIIKKVCMLGDPAVGKTSLVYRFVRDEFSEKYAVTTGTNILRNDVFLEDLDSRLALMIYDIIGQKGHNELHNMHYQNASGAVLVSDITRAATIESLEFWITSLLKVTGNIPLVICANKLDLCTDIPFESETLTSLAERFGASLLLTSAKAAVNVDDAFYTLSRKMMENPSR